MEQPSPIAEGWVEPDQADAAHRALWTACVHLRYAEKLHRRLAQASRDGLEDTAQYAELAEMERASLASAEQHLQALDRVAQLLGELSDELNRREAHRRLIGDMETYRSQTPAPTDAATSTEPLLARVRAIQEILRIDPLSPPAGGQE